MAHTTLSSCTPEPLNLTAAQQAAYDAASDCLRRKHRADEAQAAISQAPSIVRLASLSDFLLEEPSTQYVSVTSLAQGPPELARQLERLEALTDSAAAAFEQEHLERAALTNQLVQIITQDSIEAVQESIQQAAVLEEAKPSAFPVSADPSSFLASTASPSSSSNQQPPSLLRSFLKQLDDSASVPRRQVCQHPFKRNDIVWVCRTCQADETCVLCHDCFSQSNHQGHDVAFYHAQAGGCCDCGDADGESLLQERFNQVRLVL